MNSVNTAKALRNIALCLIIYVCATFFVALSSESDIGVFLEKLGLGMILVSTAAQAAITAPIRKAANGYAFAFSAMVFSAVLAIITFVFIYSMESSRFFAYAGSLCEYLTLLGGIVSAGMILIGTMQLLRKKKEKKLAEQTMKVVQNFIILTAVAVGLKIASSMLGASENMVSVAIVVALASFVLNVIAYVKFTRFLLKAAKVFKHEKA